MESAVWHYPPDFMAMMVDAIPLLVRSKSELLAFFKGAGVPETILAPMRDRVAKDRENVKMYEIARHVLYGVNDLRGDPGLKLRREIVKRVTQFTTFEKCYSDKVLQARGAVQQIRDYVRDSDTATRLFEEHERVRARSATEAARKAEALAKHNAERQQVGRDLANLFSSARPKERGKQLERVINRLFEVDGVLVVEDFRRVSSTGSGIVEQIDGVIELDNHAYLVEIKWWNEPLGVDDVSNHMTRVFARAQSRGIFIVHPGYTRGAIEKVKEFLKDAPFVLCDLEEVVHLLEAEVTVQDWLRPKVRAAIIEMNPFRKFKR